MAENNFKNLIGRRMSKTVKFMGQDIVINKLNVAEVLDIQKLSKEEMSEGEGFEILKIVIKKAADGAKDIEDSDFESFPLDELSKLANEIMKFSGLTEQQGK